MEEKEIKQLLQELTKSQVNVQNILEAFAFDNKINFSLSNKKLLKKFLNDIKEDEIDIKLLNSLLRKMK